MKKKSQPAVEFVWVKRDEVEAYLRDGWRHVPCYSIGNASCDLFYLQRVVKTPKH